MAFPKSAIENSLKSRKARREWPAGSMEEQMAALKDPELQRLFWHMLGMIRALQMQVDILSGKTPPALPEEP